MVCGLSKLVGGVLGVDGLDTLGVPGVTGPEGLMDKSCMPKAPAVLSMVTMSVFSGPGTNENACIHRRWHFRIDRMYCHAAFGMSKCNSTGDLEAPKLRQLPSQVYLW